MCASAGVSKETLCRHFGSTDELVQALLQARSDRVWQWLAPRPPPMPAAPPPTN
ncbi:TetR/AcrR family transcriptional regulator [Streptomyces sp. NBC_01727]|uniref:TetR/AcrR family transcriptional regulator n=1 Tax=Streptomyces sp. NBC_01727 TaxID=2975924 RepID=UPI002E0F963F|nr:TetR/AcrR family transcriptional regulator [Streptomyces sp. NBC_01727]